ncbi:MAG: type IV toxin-antitoxin system AbiEi family antitoxin domain-containing protein [Actinomycetota bacterium]|nr:type IV toxin-antitoxin system AbiEi family antitoxin domain-containing protein [Actinomycetota bacterium]
MEINGEAALAQRAAAQHGVFRRSDWLSFGLSATTLTRRTRAGLLVRVRPEVYAFSGAPKTWHMEVSAAVLSLGSRAAASHRTAAHLHGIVDRPERIEVVSLRTGRRPRDFMLHQSFDLARTHIATVAGIPTTTLARTIVDIGVPHGIGATGSCLDEARRRELVTLEEVARVLHQVARKGRNGVGPARRILTERLAWDQITDSQLEDRFLRILQRSNLPPPKGQFVVTDEVGAFVARVDFAYPDSFLLIELDGAAFHSDRRSFQRDRARQNRLVALGYTILRFTYWDVLAGSDVVVDTLAGFLPPNWEP